TILNLNGNPDEPFVIFPEVKRYYDNVLNEKRKSIRLKKEAFEAWEKNNPGLATGLQNILSGKLPDIDYRKITIAPNSATRAVSGTVLGEFAQKISNILVISADLSNSDKTDGFLKYSKPLKKGDFIGAFLHAGVSELTMAGIANGLALHNIIPVCGTFFAFSDFMKPAVRLAALMKLPVKYVWTHDSFRVGEDGPTHQPVEQEAQIRLMEKLKNHDGKNSMLVLRPADGAETVVAWQMALENSDSPTALLLSRQNVTDLPFYDASDRYSAALSACKGAYIIQKAQDNPDIVLIASGSEVATLVEAAEKLRNEKGLKLQVVSVISEGLFRQQDTSYQKTIIPDDIPVLALTAGLPVTMAGLVGSKGKVIGLDHFGYSAPAKVLDEKFGFTSENIVREVIDYLSKLF
ncbi:MAG: transketolase, partial [Bacteroidetes bacterium]|nr:transketolase [Bacteroidota bacterium]